MARQSEPGPEPARRTVNWSAVTSLVTALTAVGALIFTALSLNATRNQVAIAQQGQYTDRYSRAIEQLGRQGPDQLQIRLGGIYALERLAHDSPRDQPTIIEVLATFVRTSTPTTQSETGCSATPSEGPAPDVLAALRVLGRRDTTYDNGTSMNLRALCLTGADLPGVDLSNVDLTLADLRNADLHRANLKGAKFVNADLIGADLSGVNLSGAEMKAVNLNGASLINADLSGADLRAADLNANLRGANLRDTNIYGGNLYSAFLVDADLHGASLINADIGWADLRGADLSGARHNSGTRVVNVRTDSGTKGEWW